MANRATPSARSSVAVTAFVASVCLIVILLASPASAATDSKTNTITSSAGFCATNNAYINTNTSLYVEVSSLVTTYNSSSCSTVLNWPSTYMNARNIYLWFNGICDQRIFAVSNPAPYQFTAYADNSFFLCGNPGGSNLAVGQSVGYVYVGYPPSWVGNNEYTNAVVTT